MEYLRGTNSVTASPHISARSIFLPAKPSGVKPYVSQWWEVSTDVTQQHDGVTRFKPQHNVASYMTKIRLRFTLGALNAGAGAAFNRRVDYVGFLAVRKFKILYQSNEILERRGKEMLDIYHNAYKREEVRDSEAVDVHGQLTDLEREAEYGQDIDIAFDIPLPMNVATNAAWPQTTASELTVEIEWESLGNLVENDVPIAVTPVAGANNAITNQRLEIEYVFTGQSENEMLASQQMGHDGLVLPIADLQRVESTGFNADGTTQEVRIDLKDFTIASQSLMFTIQDEATVNTPWQSRRHERVGRGAGGADNLTIVDARIVASNGDFKRTINLANLTNARWAKEHPSAPDQYTFEIPLSYMPQASTTSGGMEADFTAYQSPELVLNVIGNNGSTYRFDVYSINRNLIQFQQGNVRKFWK
jgi:hypothetical protein